MTVWTLGLNHRTAPIELRERFSFASEQLEQSLRTLRQRFDTHKEVAILSTCNRTVGWLKAAVPKLIYYRITLTN
jgi:hypothetical protein